MKRDFIRNKRITLDSFDLLTIKIEKRSSKNNTGILQALINVIVYVLIFTIFFKNNLQFMGIFIAFMVASVVVQLIIHFGRSIQKTKTFPYFKIINDRKLYKKYLEKISHEINDYMSKYEQYLLSNLFPAYQFDKIITQLTTQLFCRLPSHNDFLTVNLGQTNINFPIKISYPGYSYNENDNILEQFKTETESKIENESDKLLPLAFSLKNKKRIAFANQELSKSEFNQIINALVLDVATFQAEEEVALCLAFDLSWDLDWVRFLPHVWFDNRRLVYCGSEPESDFTKLILDAIEAKSKHIVAVIDVDFAQNYRFYDLFNCDDLADKLSVIFFSHKGTVPSRVEQHVDCFKRDGKTMASYMDFELHPNFLSIEESEELAKKLFNIRLVDNSQVWSNTIPERLTFFEMFSVKNASSVPQASTEQNIHIQTRFPVKVGFGSEREDVYIDLTNDGDGNHCLVTGTNGSGKSEFMLTFVLTACSAYSPEYLSFVAIDFKGGAMSSKIRDLPHCLGEFTNGSGDISNRELTRIAELLESEIRYRENIMIEAGCANELSKYHRKYSEGKVKIALPRLLIIVDEVAVFFAKDNAAASYITHIATVGRAVGMVLLVATQSKNGIIPSQVRTNINVNVEFYSEDDNKKGLEKTKGRGLINSLKKKDYHCQVALSSIYDSNIAVVDFLTMSAKSRIMNGNARYTQFEQVYDEISLRYPTEKYSKLLDQVITEPLELCIEGHLCLSTLQEIYYDYADNSKLVYPIGISDDIYNRRREAFVFTTSAYNLLIYGKPQTGKTTLIKSLLVSMFHKSNGLKPIGVNVYIVAKNSNEYASYIFPHIGSIVRENDLYYFLLFLKNEILERSHQADSSNFRPIVAIIDDCYESVRQSEEIAQMLTFVTSESVRYKISVILTTPYKPGFGNTALRNFSSIVSFYMGDDFDYSSLMHVDAIKRIPEIKGRCLINIAGNASRTLETQIALPYSRTEGEVFNFANEYCELWIGKELPKAIQFMPKNVSLCINMKSRCVPVGLEKDLSVCYWNIDDANTYLLSYFYDNDAISFITYLVKYFVSTGLNVLVIDNQMASLSKTKDFDNVNYFNFSEQEKLKTALRKIETATYHSCDSVIVMFDYVRCLFPSGREEKDLIRIMTELIQNPTYRVCGVFADLKDFINASRNSATRFGQYLEGVNSGLLLGNAPNNHTFGFSGLSLNVQGKPLDIGWGINVSPSSANFKKIKIAMDVANCE